MSEINDENSDLGLICNLEEQVEELRAANAALKEAHRIQSERVTRVNDLADKLEAENSKLKTAIRKHLSTYGPVRVLQEALEE